MSDLTVQIGDQTLDIAKAPHVLMAGMTGSGKSMGLAHILSSLVTTYDWKQLRLWLIDPKRVELTLFRDLPHLLDWPAVMPMEAANLLWKIEREMNERYAELHKERLRDIDAFNEAAGYTKWPRLLVVIDELANLMLAEKTVARAVENAIATLTGMSRAVGIHLILATQRPTVDVVTGIIKANVPTRIAFGTVNATDSRVILDDTGAELITEPGHALMRLPRSRDLVEVHFPYVSDDTILDAVRLARSTLEVPVHG